MAEEIVKIWNKGQILRSEKIIEKGRLKRGEKEGKSIFLDKVIIKR